MPENSVLSFRREVPLPKTASPPRGRFRQIPGPLKAPALPSQRGLQDSMNRRPISVTIIACLLLLVGVAGSVFHLRELGLPQAFRGENIWIFVVEFVAIVCGAFLLYGKSWARWLAMVWIAFHVVVSFFDSGRKVATHVVILLLFAYFLFRPEANAYFRRKTTGG